MSLYGGIDLHANNSVVVLLNEQDEVIYQKRLANDLPTILGQLAPYHTELKGLVVESTYNWYWLVDGLMEASYRVHLANPAAIQQYNSLKYTDDHSEMAWEFRGYAPYSEWPKVADAMIEAVELVVKKCETMALPPPKRVKMGAFYRVLRPMELSAGMRYTTTLYNQERQL